MENLGLKWGTLKYWKASSDECKALLARYHELGSSMSAMTQEDTPEQKSLICQIIDIADCPIENDWTGKTMTKDEAKKYVMEYRT